MAEETVPDEHAEPMTNRERVTSQILDHAAALAEKCGAAAIFAYAEAIPGGSWDLPDKVAERVFYVTKTEDEAREHTGLGHRIIRVPNVASTRMGQVKLALLLALSRRLLSPGDSIICLAGLRGSASLDTIVVLEVGKEFEMFATPTTDEVAPAHVQPEVLEEVIDIAVDLGAEGREGRPVGALFVVGDTENVLPLTRQLILNPFHGYPDEQRNILNPTLKETVKEFSTIDGAFLIRGDGVIQSAGTYLKTQAFSAEDLPQGLGARHQAAAAITNVTDCITVTVSQSTGKVTLFRQGRLLMDIERARPPRTTSKSWED